MAFKHILFDCDGVITDSEPALLPIIAKIFTDAGCLLTVEDIYKNYHGMKSWQMRDRLSAKTGWNPPEDLIGNLNTALVERFKNNVPFVPHAIDTIKKLAGNVDMSVCSNAQTERLQNMLQDGGIMDLFDCARGADQVTNPKPAPDIYLETAKEKGYDSNCVVVVEDSPLGAQAGLSAGFEVFGFIGVSRNPKETKNEFINMGIETIFDDMRQLTELLGKEK